MEAPPRGQTEISREPVCCDTQTTQDYRSMVDKGGALGDEPLIHALFVLC